jgi:hypothetical protein
MVSNLRSHFSLFERVSALASTANCMKIENTILLGAELVHASRPRRAFEQLPRSTAHPMASGELPTATWRNHEYMDNIVCDFGSGMD